jgi:hypothetical protein
VQIPPGTGDDQLLQVDRTPVKYTTVKRTVHYIALTVVYKHGIGPIGQSTSYKQRIGLCLAYYVVKIGSITTAGML